MEEDILNYSPTVMFHGTPLYVDSTFKENMLVGRSNRYGCLQIESEGGGEGGANNPLSQKFTSF